MRLQQLIIPIVSAAALVLAVVVFNFLLLHAAPGDLAEVLLGESGGGSPEALAEVRRLYGLDQPLATQFAVYLGRLLHGDLGRSAYFNAPVTGLILQRLPATALLVGSALAGAVLLGTLIGTVAARRPTSLASSLVSGLSLVGYSTPVFWTGVVAILLFAVWLPLFPAQGMTNPRIDGGWWAHALDVAHHLVLPAATLGAVYLAQYARLARASMIEALGSDYVRTARAKGLREGMVVFKHALRNALLPIVTVVGLQVSHLLAGAVLVETVFEWPGLGRLAYDSILRRDVTLLLGILFCSAVLVVVTNNVVDLLYRLIDPRIRGR